MTSWASKLGQKASQLKSVTKEAVQSTREAIASEAKLVARDMADLKDGVREGVRLTVQDTSSLRERLGRDTDALRKAFAPPRRGDAPAEEGGADPAGEGQASTSILNSWSAYPQRTRRLGRFDGNDIRREAPAEEVAARFDEVIHLLAAAAMGREDAVWLKRHMNRALDALTQGLMRETCLLATTAYNPTVKGSEEACKMILTRALKTMVEASSCLELLQDRARETVLYLAENRNDAVRVFGLELAGVLFPEEQKALLEGLAASDWPHMCAIVDAGRQSNPSPPGQCEIPSTLPSPRRLVHKSLKENPVKMPRRDEDPLDTPHALFELADPDSE